MWVSTVITSTTTTRSLNATTVTVVSDLSGLIHYHWYIDGAFAGKTTNAARMFFLAPEDQVRIDVLDTTDPDFDSIANAPSGYPARRSLWWIRSTSADIARYRVEQQREAEGYVPIAEVVQTSTAWSFSVLSPRLDDLTTYDWRVVPIDVAGNEGTPLAIGPEPVVRRPDSPAFSIAFDGGTTRVTFDAAA